MGRGRGRRGGVFENRTEMTNMQRKRERERGRDSTSYRSLYINFPFSFFIFFVAFQFSFFYACVCLCLCMCVYLFAVFYFPALGFYAWRPNPIRVATRRRVFASSVCGTFWCDPSLTPPAPLLRCKCRRCCLFLQDAILSAHTALILV